MTNKTLRSCMYSIYVRPKYKLINPHNLESYAHRFGFQKVNKEHVYGQSLIHRAGTEIMHLFFTFLLIIILITGLVLYADS